MSTRQYNHGPEVSAVCAKTIGYILGRIQTDTETQYRFGWMTETFHQLCLAEAALTGEDLTVVEERRKQDLRPPHRRDEEPREKELMREVEELLEQL